MENGVNPIKAKKVKTKPNKGGPILTGVIIILLGIILLSGIYTVKTGEEAVILRFGKHVSTSSIGGLKWHIPIIEKVYKTNLSEVHRLEFGFQTMQQGNTKTLPKYESNPTQSLMITGDENLVNVETIVQYKINDTKAYYFNVDDPIGTLNVISESTIRRVVANHTLDEVLTDNKLTIQQEIRDDLQKVCDKYDIGIGISAIQLQDVEPPQEVDAAFKDVSSAREDKNSYINEANSYKNEIIPKARGNSAEMINQAEGYKQQRIEEAKGDVANFKQVYEKYQQGKAVTRTRMYLEVLEEVLPNIDKYIMSQDGSTINILPLGEQKSILPATEGN